MYTRLEFEDDFAAGRTPVEILEYFKEAVDDTDRVLKQLRDRNQEGTSSYGMQELLYRLRCESFEDAKRRIRSHKTLGCRNLTELVDLIEQTPYFDLELDMGDLPTWHWSYKQIKQDFGIEGTADQPILSWDANEVLFGNARNKSMISLPIRGLVQDECCKNPKAASNWRFQREITGLDNPGRMVR
jgi:hypothetical protein